MRQTSCTVSRSTRRPSACTNWQPPWKESSSGGRRARSLATIPSAGSSRSDSATAKEPRRSSRSSTNLSVTSEDLGEVQRTLYAPKVGTKVGSFTVSGCALEGTYTIEGKLRSQTEHPHRRIRPEIGI